MTPKLVDKVLVPVLGDQYGNVLLEGDLELELDERRGERRRALLRALVPARPGDLPVRVQPRP